MDVLQSLRQSIPSLEKLPNALKPALETFHQSGKVFIGGLKRSVTATYNAATSGLSHAKDALVNGFHQTKDIAINGVLDNIKLDINEDDLPFISGSDLSERSIQKTAIQTQLNQTEEMYFDAEEGYDRIPAKTSKKESMLPLPGTLKLKKRSQLPELKGSRIPLTAGLKEKFAQIKIAGSSIETAPVKTNTTLEKAKSKTAFLSSSEPETHYLTGDMTGAEVAMKYERYGRTAVIKKDSQEAGEKTASKKASTKDFIKQNRKSQGTPSRKTEAKPDEQVMAKKSSNYSDKDFVSENTLTLGKIEPKESKAQTTPVQKNRKDYTDGEWISQVYNKGGYLRTQDKPKQL